MAVTFGAVPKLLNGMAGGTSYLLQGIDGGCRVEIFDGDDGDILLGVKELRAGRSSQMLDVSRYAWRMVDVKPLTGASTAFASMYGRVAMIYIDIYSFDPSVEWIRSPLCDLLIARERRAVGEELSSGPQGRPIAWDECDELAMVCDGPHAEAICSAVFDGELGELPVELARGMTYKGLVALHLNMADAQAKMILAGGSPEDFDTMTLLLQLPNGQVMTRYYRIVDSAAQGRRVCWLNPFGAVDHFTFPVAQRSNVAPEGEETLTLVSGYQRRETLRWLMQIVSAERVWMFDRATQSYERVDVMANNVELREGLPEILTMSFRKRREGTL
ncbi:MAG: hypothetical protein LBH06_09350 [Rikenellaceae bacterium]|jgi:hypothetical protein|nr:hypothetical protein [Rikenellaceae bacterium]